jgi:hypothetical protein
VRSDFSVPETHDRGYPYGYLEVDGWKYDLSAPGMVQFKSLGLSLAVPIQDMKAVKPTEEQLRAMVGIQEHVAIASKVRGQKEPWIILGSSGVKLDTVFVPHIPLQITPLARDCDVKIGEAASPRTEHINVGTTVNSGTVYINPNTTTWTWMNEHSHITATPAPTSPPRPIAETDAEIKQRLSESGNMSPHWKSKSEPRPLVPEDLGLSRDDWNRLTGGR